MPPSSTPRPTPAKVPRAAPSTARSTPRSSGPARSSGARGTAKRRYRKVLKDTIQGVTKGDIRRMARRGGVKRISAGIYDEARLSLKDFLIKILGDAIACVELRRAQTVIYTDIIYALKRRGHTLYGFGPQFDQRVVDEKKRQQASQRAASRG